MRLKSIFLFFIFNCISVFSSNVDTLTVVSKSMDKTIKNVVIIPDSYQTNNNNYPVLYLLHGANGDYTNWVTRVPKLKEYADKYNMLIVCPDGGNTSWYFNSPIDKNFNYETYISKELIKKVDKKYRTLPKKQGRAITGLSMGGHGAFYLAFKHQNIWGAVGSMSGCFDIRQFPFRWDLSKRLGEYYENKNIWEENTVINMVYRLKKNSLKLIFDCGVKDIFYKQNKSLHKKLIERNIPHDYIERAGGHSWNYWANSIEYQLLFFYNYFKSVK
ncbi:MAG: esterase family protein [Tenacibaculum sp.]|nr:esterase family protein [Tenacibaculum sp.]